VGQAEPQNYISEVVKEFCEETVEELGQRKSMQNIGLPTECFLLLFVLWMF